MRAGKNGLEPAPDLAKRIQLAVNKLSDASRPPDAVSWSVVERQPLLDSANIRPADWESIAASCREQTDAQGIVIVHGTDTLAYTACALAYLLQDLSTPIIVTGSQKPLEAKDSDALDNLLGATEAATSAPRGIWVFFHGQLMPATRVVKKDALGLAGFTTPRIAITPADKTHKVRVRWQSKPKPWGTIQIPVVHMTPGYDATYLASVIANAPNAIILSLYGVGTLADQNTALLDALNTAQRENIVVVAVTQCYIGRIDFSLYAAGGELSKLGVISGRDMTLEAAYTKLMVLFRMGYSNNEIKQLFTRAMAGELSDT